PEMPVACLVCGKHTFVTHMGLNICRACMVFYRRTYGIRETLLCLLENCTRADQKNRFFACRKCRFDRIEDVLSNARGDDDIYYSSLIARSSENLMLCQNSLIEKIRFNLCLVSANRYIGEFKLRGINVTAADAIGTRYPLYPCTYKFMDEATKILIPCLFKFSETVFPGFRELAHDEKWLLIRNYETMFNFIDAELRILRTFGKASDKLIPTYTTFITLDGLADFFPECPDQRNVATAVKTLRDFLLENIGRLKKQILLVDPTEEEFHAMIG
ncbi:hypothetical protein PMAYCL1PPCAC_31848, partial [Pristionchus mayeri]